MYAMGLGGDQTIMIIYRLMYRSSMAKGETFFIRGQVATVQGDQSRVVSTIDLGSYVNLGVNKGTAMRVHGVQLQVCDAFGLPPTTTFDAEAGESISSYACAAITTKAVPSSLGSSSMPELNDDSVFFTAAFIQTNQGDANDQGIQSHSLDVAPQHMKDGYLLAVDELYLYAAADDAWSEILHFNFLLEVSLENITQANAVALSLSQQ